MLLKIRRCSSSPLSTSGVNDIGSNLSLSSDRVRVRFTVAGVYATALFITSLPLFLSHPTKTNPISGTIELYAELPAAALHQCHGCQWIPGRWAVHAGNLIFNYCNIIFGILACNLLLASTVAVITFYLWRKRLRLNSVVKATTCIMSRRHWLRHGNRRHDTVAKTNDEMILTLYLDELSLTIIVTCVVLVVIWMPSIVS